MWIAYISAVRAEKRPEHADLSFGDLCKILSPVWKAMSREEKQPYITAYERDKVRYNQQVANLSDEDKKILRAHKRRKRTLRAGKPKAVVSAYMLYVCKARAGVVAANPSISFPEIGRTLGAQWRQLGDAERKEFLDQSQLDRSRYEKEMREWRAAEEEKRQTRRTERDQKRKTKTNEAV